MVLVATVLDPSLGHCHPPTTHLLQTAGLGGTAKVFIGPNFSPPVLLGDLYVTTSCGDTAHVPAVTLGSPNVFVGSARTAVSFQNATLSCGDFVGANPANNVFVN